MSKSNLEFDFTVIKWGLEFCGTCTGTFTPGTPAQTYGPPENCYPGDADEFDVSDVCLTSVSGTPPKPGPVVLTEAGLRAFCEDFYEEILDKAREAWDVESEAAFEARAESREDDDA